jgi:nitric oxide reductase activation protein
VERVKRLFQRLKPDLTAREKRLPAGDRIDIDRLVRFVTMQRARLHPEDRFWIKPRFLRRDLAVALVLDVSGSTGKQSGARDVLAMEKESARLLAAGLSELGDRFGIFGFTGNGRERCAFGVYKGFDEPWDNDAIGRLMAARPGAATRIGVALRHAGWKLSEVAAKSRLIILITDGRPMDADYEARTHYAHFDVRKACQENRQEGIHTFCIALEPESAEELTIMFPAGGYLILNAVSELPEALTGAYLRLTGG